MVVFGVLRTNSQSYLQLPCSLSSNSDKPSDILSYPYSNDMSIDETDLMTYFLVTGNNISG